MLSGCSLCKSSSQSFRAVASEPRISVAGGSRWSTTLLTRPILSSILCCAFLVVLVRVRVATTLINHVIEDGSEQIRCIEAFDRVLEQFSRCLPGTHNEQDLIRQAAENVAVRDWKGRRRVNDDVRELLLQPFEQSPRFERSESSHWIRRRHVSGND